MEWHFVGRTQLLETIRHTLRAGPLGPVVITGEPGAGRTALLNQLLESPEAAAYSIVHLHPSDPPPGTTDESGRLAQVSGRPLLVVMDDAHLCEHENLLALRELSRAKQATVLVTTVDGEAARRPDPTDCLRFEPGARSLRLRPFTVEEVGALLAEMVGGHVRQATAAALHSASRGNAALLHELLIARSLVDRLTRGAGGWELRPVTQWSPRIRPARARRHLVEATWEAWRSRAFDRAYELCKAAAWCGEEHLVAVPMAHLLLLRGLPHECALFLDSLSPGAVETTPHLALAKAINLACGLGQPLAAADFLLRAALHPVQPYGNADTENGQAPWERARIAKPQPLYLAYRAWILALTGPAAQDVRAIERDDRETALFVHAAEAMAALRDRSEQAVFHLRRALALVASGMDAGPPWLSPHLTACLIDALLLAGRTNEATLLAAGFHGGEPTSGWDVAVAVSMLTAA